MFEKCPYFAINAAARELSRLWDHHFITTGLSASQAYLVILIAKQPGLAQKEIATTMNLERSTVARLLESLEGKGLIRRESDERDARGSKVFVTAKGSKLSPDLIAISQNLMKQLNQKVPEEKLQNLVTRTHQVMKELRS